MGQLPLHLLYIGYQISRKNVKFSHEKGRMIKAKLPVYVFRNLALNVLNYMLMLLSRLIYNTYRL